VEIWGVSSLHVLSYFVLITYFGVFFDGGDLVLARQVLYHLSHASSPFCFGMESYVYVQTGPDCSPPIYAHHLLR
jgi:hypothetical protein